MAAITATNIYYGHHREIGCNIAFIYYYCLITRILCLIKKDSQSPVLVREPLNLDLLTQPMTLFLKGSKQMITSYRIQVFFAGSCLHIIKGVYPPIACRMALRRSA
ncbi:hypothetical protein RchiOBHm_Chr2g0140471 [Rosa chinensis]|uniref:Uncharacterized protein n=1 Tax=Rosa chinensis TaxID=74649 RepID=A0A2P6RXB3_ROSCH|nr:hypothetical protein RchiOBHm_Chr2g0140471 [Rosa chinensis]